MTDESYSFATARVRLEEIVTQVRKKDTSLEKSLDLLEEGVRLANQCTELIDHADWEAASDSGGSGSPGSETETTPRDVHGTSDVADADETDAQGPDDQVQSAGDHN